MYREVHLDNKLSMALTNGQSIPDQLNNNAKLYDGIIQMIHVALDDCIDMDPEKSVLAKVGIKLAHPETYLGGSDLEEFEVVVAGILRWLKMNSLLGPTSTNMQVGYLGTCLTGEAQEWFYRNIEGFN